MVKKIMVVALLVAGQHGIAQDTDPPRLNVNGLSPLRATWSASPVIHAGGACTKCHQATPSAGPAFDHSLLWYGANGKLSQGHSGLVVSTTVPDTTTRTLLGLAEDSGLIVTAVCERPSVNPAGLEVNDIILKVNDRNVGSTDDFTTATKETSEVVLEVLRDGKKTTLRKPAEVKPTTARYIIGVRLGELEPVVRSQLKLEKHANVVVLGIQDDTAASAADIQENDILLQINGSPAISTEVVQEAVRTSDGKPVLLGIFRDGTKREVAVTPRKIDVPVTTHAEISSRAYDQFYRILDLNSGQPVWADSGESSPVQERLDNIEKQLIEIKKLIGQLNTPKN